MEKKMKIRWIAFAFAALGLIAADPALAKKRHAARPVCIDRPAQWSFWGVWANPAPYPNGCAPPVYAYGRFIGQDPDPFIRQQMMRDPTTGNTGEFSR
jgi:hypothetical protein